MIRGQVEMVRVMDEDGVASQCRYVCLLSLLVEGDADAVAEILGELHLMDGHG